MEKANGGKIENLQSIFPVAVAWPTKSVSRRAAEVTAQQQTVIAFAVEIYKVVALISKHFVGTVRITLLRGAHPAPLALRSSFLIKTKEKNRLNISPFHSNVDTVFGLPDRF